MWLHRLGEIQTAIEAHSVPVLDRRSFELLFHVRRRRALQLMQQFGGYHAGSSMLVDRQCLLTKLAEISTDPACRQEEKRWERINTHLEQLHRREQGRQITLNQPHTTSLPPGLSLQPGLLTVQFQGARDLLTKLYGLVEQAANDFEEFERRLEPNQD